MKASITKTIQKIAIPIVSVLFALIIGIIIIELTGNIQQRMFALMIKFMELQKTASLFNGKAPSMQVCSSTDPQERISQMLADIRGYCTPKEQENIDMALNMIQMLSTYEVLFN